MPTVRIMSYNLDGCRDLAAVLRTIDAAGADVAALQNFSSLPTNNSLSNFAERVGYPFFTLGKAGSLALLSKTALKFIQTYAIGSGACCMKAHLNYQEKRFILMNINLTGGFFERPAQIRNLLGPNLIDQDSLALPTLLLGDFYDIVWVSGHYRFNDKMRRFAPRLWRATYPASFPLVSRDRVYAMGGICLHSIYIDHSKSARSATAHLPTIFDLEINDTREVLIQRDRVRTAHLEVAPG